jgi:hypothetical protein
VVKLGNLAVVCAQRPDVLLQIMDGTATLFVGSGPGRDRHVTDWRDDAKIEELIHELNFGTLRKEALNDAKH